MTQQDAEAPEDDRRRCWQTSKVNERIATEHNLATTCIRAERMHHSKEFVRLLQKLEGRLDKQSHEQDASINQMRPISDLKLDKMRHAMFAISNKLEEQRLVWQNCLAKLDSLTKNHLSNKQVLTEEAKPMVVVQWDPMPDVEGKEGVSN